MRLDQHLVEQGLFESRARAQGAIKAGLVRVNGVAATKPSQAVGANAAVEIDGDVHPYVSRGGLKLEAALRAMEIDPAGKKLPRSRRIDGRLYRRPAQARRGESLCGGRRDRPVA